MSWSPVPTMESSKKHFEILDGLRGVAALAVVLFHFMEMIISDYSKNFIGHGFLAVDFFFCLSGFVIGYAYDHRIAGMGPLEFFKSRLIRLHPLVILGSLLGLIAFLFDPFSGIAASYGPGRIALIFVCSLLLIPFPVMQERSFNLFGLNAPCWSLFWEYIANIFYALVLWRIGRRGLLLLLLPAIAALCFVGYRSSSLMGGWGGESFWDGGARVACSFLIGLFLFRSGWIIPTKLGWLPLSFLLSLAFLMPYFGKANWLAEIFVALFYFPFLIALGAGVTLRPALKNLCRFAGKISYPLYMTHYSVIWIFSNYYNSQKPDMTRLAWIIPTAIVLLLGLAWLALICYDTPVRRYLSARRNRKTGASS